MKEFVSIKSKSSNSAIVYVVEKGSIVDFIAFKLDSDTIILVDSVETFAKSE